MLNDGDEKYTAVTDINNVIDGFAGIALSCNVINANRIDEIPKTNNKTESRSTFTNPKHKPKN